MYGESNEILTFEFEDLIILKSKVRNHYDLIPGSYEWFENVTDVLFNDLDEFYSDIPYYTLLQLNPSFDEGEAQYLKENNMTDCCDYWHHVQRALVLSFLVKEFSDAKQALIRVN